MVISGGLAVKSRVHAAGNRTFLPIPATFKLKCYQLPLGTDLDCFQSRPSYSIHIPKVSPLHWGPLLTPSEIFLKRVESTLEIIIFFIMLWFQGRHKESNTRFNWTSLWFWLLCVCNNGKCLQICLISDFNFDIHVLSKLNLTVLARQVLVQSSSSSRARSKRVMNQTMFQTLSLCTCCSSHMSI